MKISDLIATHEAGHVVVADALGFNVQYVIMTDQGPAVAVECPVEPTPNEHFMMAAWALAGGVAQDRLGHPPDRGCMGDLNEAAAHMSDYLCAPVDDRDSVMKSLMRANDLAQAIVGHRWELVMEVAQLIQDRGADVPVDVLAPVLESAR